MISVVLKIWKKLNRLNHSVAYRIVLSLAAANTTLQMKIQIPNRPDVDLPVPTNYSSQHLKVRAQLQVQCRKSFPSGTLCLH